MEFPILPQVTRAGPAVASQDLACDWVLAYIYLSFITEIGCLPTIRHKFHKFIKHSNRWNLNSVAVLQTLFSFHRANFVFCSYTQKSNII